MVYESTVDYYNNQSGQYSQKRYEGKVETYFQFLFRRRSQLFLDFLGKISDTNNLKILEIGCADGVLIKKVLQKKPVNIDSIVGIDISEKMLEKARETTNDTKVKYFMRNIEENSPTKYDIVIELGVHVSNLENEIKFVTEKLNSSGYFLYSVAGKNSLHVKIKLRDKDYAKEYLNYSEYDVILSNYFETILSKNYGLFIPKLWAVPTLARVVQPIIEVIFRNIFPDLFHEKIYLLRKR